MLGYTPVIVPVVLPGVIIVPAIGFPAVASTSGWTMLIFPLNAAGFPKNMNSLPGFNLSNIHLIPLKKTISMSPVPSLTHTLILRIVLNFRLSLIEMMSRAVLFP